MRITDRRGTDAAGVMGDNVELIIALVKLRFKDPLLQVGKLCPLEPTDKIFRLPREHGATDDLYPPPPAR